MKSNTITALCLACLAVLAAGLVFLTVTSTREAIPTAASAAHNWYYKPRQDGGQPTVADDAPFLSNYPYLCLGNAEEKTIYLTFDCGYDNGYIAKILDVLREKQVPAAFFVTGHFMDSSPDIVRRMAAEGHLVCNHSVNHKDLSGASPDFFQKEIGGLCEKYEAITGTAMPRYVRPPEGKYSENFLELCRAQGYLPVFWSFAYKDWLNDAQPAPAQAIETILSRTHPGEVALLHSTSATNAEILGELIDRWRAEGYALKSLDDLAREQGLAVPQEG